MNVYHFGDSSAENIIIQAIDNQSLPSIDNEVRILHELTDFPFCLMAVTVDDWFIDLSPCKAPAVFGNNTVGDGASNTLSDILDLCSDKSRNYYLGGYSLSGLFALWSAYQTDVFKGVAAASPSMWFPGFTDYMENHDIGCNTVYLSIGDREGKTKNTVMATVDECIRKAHDLLIMQGVECILEYNRGNHFADVEGRCARAFAWVLEKA